MKRVIRCSEQQLHDMMEANGFKGIRNTYGQYRARIGKGNYPRFHLFVKRLPNKVKILDLHIDFEPHTNFTNDNIEIANMLLKFDYGA